MNDLSMELRYAVRGESRARAAFAKVCSWGFKRMSQSTSSSSIRADPRFCSTILFTVKFGIHGLNITYSRMAFI